MCEGENKTLIVGREPPRDLPIDILDGYDMQITYKLELYPWEISDNFLDKNYYLV